MASQRKSSRKQQYRWESYSDQKLLSMRFCDLALSLSGTTVERRIERLYDELDGLGIVFRPHFWLSTEWFAPDDIPGIAVPFYLAHRRLRTLERRQVFEVEGGTEQSCMKLLRHETGHAIETAYRLHRRKGYRTHFGSPSKPYPTHYTPKPYSRNYVLHLDLWYAQAHPMEDFAETFAVWMRGPKQWRARYKGWRALKKLEYMNELMEEIKGTPPLVRSRAKVEPLSRIRKTLRTHYNEKRERYGIDDKGFYDQELRRLFAGEGSDGTTAASFLRKHRKELRSIVARWSGDYAYRVDQILEQMIARAGELHLRAEGDAEQLIRESLAMLSVQVTNSMLSETRRIPI